MSTRKILLLAASVAGLSLAAPAAQAQSVYDRDGYYDDTESVIVVGPREGRARGHLGGEIRTVSISRDVSYADLDLRSDYGADRLYSRIRSTARSLCDRLDFQHPITAKDSPPCYSNAVQEAMLQADDAIARARGE